MQNCDPFAISFLLKVGRGRFAHGAVTQVLRWVWPRVGTPRVPAPWIAQGAASSRNLASSKLLPPRCREWGPSGTPGSDKTPSTGTRPRMYRSGRLTPAAFCLSSKRSRAVTSIRSSRPRATSPSFRRTRRDAQPISQYIRQDSDLQTSAQGEGMCCALSHASTTARAHQDRTTSGSVRRRFRGICR